MSCERAIEVNSQVVVEFPTSPWKDRRRACCNVWDSCVNLASIVSLLLCIAVIFYFPIRIIVLSISLVAKCQAPPTLSMGNVNIHNMLVYQNSTDSPYQVRSEFRVNLTARNPNTVAKCFSTFRRMSESVEFQGQQIVQQEVPLGFGLKPKERCTVKLDLRGDGYRLKKDSALSLDLVLRNSSRADFVFTFKSRVMRNDRKASWVTTRCDTIIRTPPNGNFSQANSTGGLAWFTCKTV